MTRRQLLLILRRRKPPTVFALVNSGRKNIFGPASQERPGPCTESE